MFIVPTTQGVEAFEQIKASVHKSKRLTKL